MEKNQNKFILAGVVLAALVGFIWLARPASQSAPASPVLGKNGLPAGKAGALTVQENNYDFGSISMAAGKVSKTFAIKNTGTDPLAINQLYTSCMCTEATLKIVGRSAGPFGMPGHGFAKRINETILPNEEAEVEVIFDPAAHGPAGVGRIERAVYLENSAGAPLELKFSATVTP
ncbi:MAG: DUF1573 domain-containing protein [Candidatus Giovannonibacteria bacterium]|nr:DUF1573 domain-containing protein [Candidatus Giovannonibacteria bacterium]